MSSLTPEQRVQGALAYGPKLYASHRIADFFDVVYEPTLYDNRLQPLMLRIAYDPTDINLLRPDQVELLQQHVASSKQPLPQYLYAYWLYYNRKRWSDISKVGEMMRWAAECGIGDAAWFLHKLWLSGEAGVYDEETAEDYLRHAEKYNSNMAFVNSVEKQIEKDPKEAISYLKGLVNDHESQPLEEGQYNSYNPYIWYLLYKAYFALERFSKAEEYARRTVDGGLVNKGYDGLLDATQMGNEDCTWGMLLPILNEGNNNQSSNCLMQSSLYMAEQYDDESTTEEEREGLAPRIREMLEDAATLGNSDACCTVGSYILSERYGYERDMEQAWHWFHRGAMCGDADCIHMLYYLSSKAEDPELDHEDMAFYYSEDMEDRMPASDWERLARKVHESRGLEWPGNYEDDE